MHESSLIPDLMEKILSVARDNGAQKIATVDLRIGALAAIAPDHLRDHFIEASRGCEAEGAELRIVVDEDLLSPHAHTVLLEAVEIEE